MEGGGGVLTSLIRCDILPSQRVLLFHLVLQVLLPLVQQLQLLPQLENGFFGRILLGLTTAEPAETPARHGYCAIPGLTRDR